MALFQLGVLLPGARQVGDGINGAVRGIVRTLRGDITAIVKSLPPRELTVELFCAALGRQLGLPIPDALVVQMADSNLAFGSSDVGHPSMKRCLATDSGTQVSEVLKKWSKLVNAASFDEWIANCDRNQGNILFDGQEGLWLIDHGLAMKAGLPSDALVTNQLLTFAKHGQNEMGLQRIKKHLMALADSYQTDDIRSIAERMAYFPNISELEDFLIQRISKLSWLARQKVKTQQRDLDYGG